MTLTLPTPEGSTACQNRRTFVWYDEHTPDISTGRCGRCGTPSTAYDTHADWYDRFLAGDHADDLHNTVSLVQSLLEPVQVGYLVDLGCGSGLVSGVLTTAGWDVIGVDASAPMLAYAARRISLVRHATAIDTGLPAGSARVVISTWTHTDIPWSPGLVDEAARLLVPGGWFVYVGGDPDRMPPPTKNGVRTHVGSQELTAAELLKPFTSGPEWEIEQTAAGGRPAVPMIGWRAVRR